MLSGKIVFVNRPYTNDDEPNTKHNKFSLKVSSTVFIDFPPYLTIVNWMIIVAIKITKNNGLLKKCSNTLTSLIFSFLALISLNTCSNTNTLKKIE